MPPRPCKFFQQGNCRYGDSCKFDHTPQDRSFSNENRFAPLQNSGNSSQRHDNGFQGGGGAGSNRFQQGGGGNGFQGGGSGGRFHGVGSNNGFQARPAQVLDFALDKAAIHTDLIKERPQWILSAYGPGRHAPAQLFGGPMREQSFEEMRLLHYTGMASGNPQQAVQDAERLVQASEQQIQNAANNVDGAIKFIIDSKENHPNRVDICNSSTGVDGGFRENPINQGTAGASLIPPNTLGTNPPGTANQPMATSALGFPTPAASAFGQTPVLGHKPNVFGTPSQPFGSSTQSSTGVFGQASNLGQRPNAFAPSNQQTNQPNPFSTYASNGTGFNQQPQNTTNNVFGQTIQPNPFGAPSSQGLTTQTGLFGQASGSTTTLPSSKNPFGTPQSPSPNPFAQGNTQPAAFNPFKTQSNPPVSNPFAQNDSIQAANITGSSADKTNPINTQPILNGGHQSGPVTWQRHKALAEYASVDASGRLTMFNGKKVTYRNGEPGTQNPDGSWQRIWNPKGPLTVNAQTEMDESFYNESVEDAYKHLRRNGTFPGAIMPMIPPKKEWCRFDF